MWLYDAPKGIDSLSLPSLAEVNKVKQLKGSIRTKEAEIG